ncbi:MAG: hypothetical protein ACPKM1_15720 [Spirochaetaceae bacterium]
MGEAKNRGTFEERKQQAKEKKDFRPTKEWAVWLINLNIGPYINVLGAIEPASAGQLVDALVVAITTEAKKPEYVSDHGKFITDMGELIHRLWGQFAGAKLEKYLEKGVPTREVSNVIKPSGIVRPN